jgi:ubiquinone/menaquinone biosynthesis C-methylase UbiE
MKNKFIRIFRIFFTALFTPLYRAENKVYSEIFKKFVRGGKLAIDIGCDGRGLLEELSTRYELVCGIDIDKNALKKAKEVLLKTNHLQNVMLIASDAHHLPFREQLFDLITCTHVLEHTLFPEIVLSEFLKILKKNGIVFIVVPWMSEILGLTFNPNPLLQLGRAILFRALDGIHSRKCFLSKILLKKNIKMVL